MPFSTFCTFQLENSLLKMMKVKHIELLKSMTIEYEQRLLLIFSTMHSHFLMIIKKWSLKIDSLSWSGENYSYYSRAYREMWVSTTQIKRIRPVDYTCFWQNIRKRLKNIFTLTTHSFIIYIFLFCACTY